MSDLPLDDASKHIPHEDDSADATAANYPASIPRKDLP